MVASHGLLVKAERIGLMGKSFEFKECERFLKRALKDKGMYSKGAVIAFLITGGIGFFAPPAQAIIYVETDLTTGATGASSYYNGSGSIHLPRNSVVLAPIKNGDLNGDLNRNAKDSVIIGAGAVAHGITTESARKFTAVGNAAHVFGGQGTAVGSNALAAEQATAIGNDVYAAGASSIAIGNDDISTKYRDIIPLNTIKELYGDPNGKNDAAKKLFRNIRWYSSENEDKGEHQIVDWNKFATGYNQSDESGLRIFSPTYSGGIGSIAIGSRSIAAKDGATAMGTLAYALGEGSTAMGLRAYTASDARGAVAIGEESRSFAAQSLAVGNHNESSNIGAMSYGYDAKAVGDGSLAFGFKAYANAKIVDNVAANAGNSATNPLRASVRGQLETYTEAQLAALGKYQDAVANYYKKIKDKAGDGAIATAKAAMNTARAVVETFQYTDTGQLKLVKGGLVTYQNDHKVNDAISEMVATTNSYKTTPLTIEKENGVYLTTKDSDGNTQQVQKSKKDGNNAIAIGYYAAASGTASIAQGAGSVVDSDSGIGIGSLSHVSKVAANSIAVGVGAQVRKENSISIGTQASVYGAGAIGMGSGVRIMGDNSLGLGYGAMIKSRGSVSIGNSSKVELGSQNSTSLGADTSIGINAGNTVALGNSATISNEALNSMALGYSSIVGENATNSIAMGTSASIAKDAASSVAVGESASVTKSSSMALGRLAQADFENSVALGYRSTTHYWGNPNTRQSKFSDKASTDNVHGLSIKPYLPQGSTLGTELEKLNAVTAGYVSVGGWDEKGADGKSTGRRGLRRIVNVAPGALDTDAVTVAQLRDWTDKSAHFLSIAGASNKSATDYPDINDPLGTKDSKNNVVKIKSNFDNDTATGTNALALGVYAYANGQKSVALGPNAYANVDHGVAIGDSAQAWSEGSNGNAGVAIGKEAKAYYWNALALGTNARVSGAHSLAFGPNARVGVVKTVDATTGNVTNEGAKVNDGIAIGRDTAIDGTGSVALGATTKVTTATNAVAIGTGAKVLDGVDANDKNKAVQATGAIALGSNASVTGSQYSVALGLNSSVVQDDTKAKTRAAFTNEEINDPGNGVVSVGNNSSVKRRIINVASGVNDNDAVTVKQLKAAASKYYSVNTTDTDNRTVNGVNDVKSNVNNDGATGTGAVAVGSYTKASGNYATAIGRDVITSAQLSTGIGTNVTVSGQRSVGIGNEARAIGSNTVAIGSNGAASQKVEAVGNDAVAIGTIARAYGGSSVALGRDASTGYTTTETITNPPAGGPTTSTVYKGASEGVAIGNSSYVDSNYAIAIGGNAKVERDTSDSTKIKDSESSVAIGAGAKVTGAKYSVALGLNSRVNAADTDTKTTAAFSGEVNNDPGFGVVSVGQSGKYRRILNVAGGVNDNDAVNVKQLKAAAWGLKTQSGTAAAADVTPDTNGKVTLKAGNNVTIDNANGVVTVNATGIQSVSSGNTNALSVSTTNGTVTITPNLAGSVTGTGNDANKLVTAGVVNAAINNIPVTSFKADAGGNNGTEGVFTPTSSSKQVNITGAGVNGSTRQTWTQGSARFDSDNIGTHVNSDGRILVGMKNKIAVNEVATYDYNSAGAREATQGPTLSSTGLDMKNKKITNVADGDITAGSKDAINGGQLHSKLAEKANVADLASKANVTDLENKVDKTAELHVKAGDYTVGNNGEVSLIQEDANGTINNNKGFKIKGLATKNDINTINTTLAGKADKSYVDTQIGTVSNLGYKVNSGTAKQVAVGTGLNFVQGDGTTATAESAKAGIQIVAGDDGKVTFGLNEATRNAIDNAASKTYVDTQVGNAANKDLDNLNDAGRNKVKDLAAQAVKVAAGKNVTVTPTTADHVTTYTVDAIDTKVIAGEGLEATGGDTVDTATNTRNYTVGLSAATKATLAKVSDIAKAVGADGANGIDGRDGKPGTGDNAGMGKDGLTKEDGLNGKDLTTKVNALRNGEAGTVVYTDENGKRVVKAKDGKWYLADKVDATGNKLDGATEVTTPQARLVNPDGTTTGGTTKLSNISDGEIKAGSKDAINGGQLHSELAKKADVTALEGKVDKAAEFHVKADTYAVGEDGVVTVKQEDGTGAEATDKAFKISGLATKTDITNINNTLADKADKGTVDSLKTNPITFTGDDAQAVTRALGTTLTVKGTANFTPATDATAGVNIRVEKDATENANGLVVKLADTLTNMKGISGNGTDPLTIKNGDNAVITVKPGANGAKGDVDFGGSKLTNVGAPGANTDAANKFYVDEAIKAVNQTAAGNANLGYKANGGTAKTVAVTTGLDFVQGDGTTATAEAAKAGLHIETGDNGKVIIGLSEDAKTKLDKVDTIAATVGANGADGRDGKAGTGKDPQAADATAGDKGLTGKDGLNGKDLTSKVNALRNGEAGTVVYTDENGNRLAKANDGQYYPATNVDKDGNVLNNAQPVTSPQARLVNPTGSTTTATKLSNIADGTIGENSKDAINGGQLHTALAGKVNTGLDNLSTDGENKVKDLAAGAVKVAAGKNVKVTPATADHVTTYTVDAIDTKVIAGEGLEATGGDTVDAATNTRNYTVGLSQATKATLAKVSDIAKAVGADGANGIDGRDGKPGTGDNAGMGKDGLTKEDGLNGKDLTTKVNALRNGEAGTVVYTDENGKRVVKAKDGKWYLADKVDATGNKLDGATEVTTPQARLVNPDGTTTGGTTKLSNISDGEIKAGSKDAINGGQLHSELAKKADVTALEGKVDKAAEFHVKADTYAVGEDGVVTVKQEDGTGAEATDKAFKISGLATKTDITNINNTLADKADKGTVDSLKTNPITFTGDDAQAVTRALGTTLTVKGAANFTPSATNPATEAGVNIRVEKDPTTNANGLVVKLADTLTNMKGISGNGQDDLVIKNGDNAVITVKPGANGAKGDVDFGGSKLTNVGAPGANTDAANKFYVDEAIKAVNQTAAGNANLGYKANGGTAKTVAVTTGLDFVQGDGTTATAEAAKAGLHIETGDNGKVIIGLSEDAKTKLDKVDTIAATVGANGADGRDGKAGTGKDPQAADATAGDKGLTGKDGLNGKDLTSKVNALRNGEAGTVVYTDENGNRLAKANDGQYYPATNVDKDGNVLNNAQPVTSPQARLVNPTGSTTTATKLSNIADGTIGENSKDAINGGQLHTALAGKVNTGLDNLSTDGENKVKDLAAGAVKVAAGKNVKVTPATADHVTTYTVDAIDTKVIAGEGLEATGGDTVDAATNTRNYTVGLSQATKATLAKVSDIAKAVGADGANGIDGRDGKPGTGDNAGMGKDGLTKEDGLNGKDLTTKVNALRNGEAGTVVYTDENGKRVVKAKDGKWYLADKVDATGNKLDGATEVTTPQARLVNPDGSTTTAEGATGTKLSNIANGTIADKSKDAVNGGQLYTAKQELATALGGNATVTNGVLTGPTYEITKDDGTNGKDSVNNVGAAVEKLDARINTVKGLAVQPLTFTGDDAQQVTRTLGTELTVKGAANFTPATDATAGVNIRVEKDATENANGLVVKLADTLTNMKGISGNGTDPLTIKNGDNAVITVKPGANGAKGDVDFGGSKLTNVGAPGANTDAANKFYVDEAIKAVNQTAAGNANLGYKANGGTAKTVAVTTGLDFVQGDGTTATAEAAKAGLHIETGDNGKVIIGLSEDAKTKLDKVDTIAATVGANGADGRDGKAGTGKDPQAADATAGDKGLTGKDGLNGKDLTSKVNALRNGEAGTVVYTDENGNRLAKANDGQYYPATNVDKDGNVLNNAQPVTSPQARLVNPTGSTTTATKLSNIADGTIGENSKDAINGGQLHTELAKKADVTALDSKVDKEAEFHVKADTYAVGEDGVVTVKQEDGTGAEATGKAFKISGLATKTDITNINNTLADKADKSDITTINNTLAGKANASDLNTLAEKTLTFSGDTGTNATRKLGETLAVKGAANFTPAATATPGVNIQVASDPTNGLTVSLADTLTKMKGISGNGQDDLVIKNGDNVVITVKPGATATKGDVDFGGSKLTNIGTPGAGTDAANKDYVDAQVGTAANKNLDNLNDAGLNKVKDLAAQAVKVAPGKNVSVTDSTTDHVTTYTVDAIDTTVAAGEGLSVTGGDTVDTTTNKRNYTVALSADTQAKLAKVENLANTVGTNGSDGRDGKAGTGKNPQAADATAGDKGLTGKDGLNGKDLTSKVNALRNGEAGTVVYTDENGNRLAKANDGKWYLADKVGADGTKADDAVAVATPQARLVNPDGSTTTAEGAIGTELSNIANGTIADKSKDAVNGGQLHTAKQEMANALGGNAGVDANGALTQPTYSITKDDAAGGTDTVNNVGAAVSKLDARINTVKEMAVKPLTFTGDDAKQVSRTLGTELTVKGAANFTPSATDPATAAGVNIRVEKDATDGANGLVVKLADTLTKMKGISGNGQDDLVIKNGDNAVITVKPGATGAKGDVDFGGSKLTNVGAPGANTDAANKLYVDEAIKAVNQTAAGNANLGYKANSGTSKTVAVTTGLDFVQGDGTTATAESAKSGLNIVAGDNGKVIIGLSNDAKTKLDKVDTIANTVGTNGADGRDGKPGTGADAGMGAQGPTGQDGLNGKDLTSKVNALRNGEAGTVVYTDENGNRLAKANDGKWYLADKVGADGTKADDAAEVTTVQARLVNPTGSTTTATKLSNIADGTIGENSKDAINGGQLFNKLAEKADKSDITTINNTLAGKANASDLNTLAEKTLTFSGDTGTNATRKLGETLAVKGAANFTPAATATPGVNIQVASDPTNGLTVSLADTLTKMKGISGNGQDDLVIKNGDNVVITVKPGATATKGDVDFGGSKLTNIGTPGAGTDAANKDYVDAQVGTAANKNLDNLNDAGLNKVKDLAAQAVKVAPGKNVSVTDSTTDHVTTYTVDAIDTTVVAGDGLSVTGGDTVDTTTNKRNYTVALSADTQAKLAKVENLTTTVGTNGADGRDGKPGTGTDAGMGKDGLTKEDGLNGKDLTTKVNALRNGEAGPVVYTDENGKRVVKAKDGKWYLADKVGADGTKADDAAEVTTVQARLVNPTGSTTTATKLSNIADGTIGENSKDAINGGQLFNKLAEKADKSDITTINNTLAGKANASDLNTLAEKTLTFSGDTGTNATRKLGETLAVKGAANFTPAATATPGVNIQVASDPTNGLTVSLADTLTKMKGISGNGQDDLVIKNGDNVVITVKPGATATKGDVDFGGSKLTNIGTPGAGTDAANKDYVDAQVGTAANKNLDNLNDAGLNKVKDLAAQAVKVAPGKNVSVTDSTTDHVTTYTVDAIDTTVAAGEGLSVTGGDTVDTTTNKRNYTVALSADTQAKLAKVENLANTVGTNGSDGRDGKAGTGKNPQAADATAGDKGLTGKDGLNGKDLTSKVNALRNGEAGTVVYTDENGNRLAKANDGQYYPATNVDKDGNVLNNAQPVTSPQARLVNPTGSTTTATKLSNIADGTIGENSKDAINGGQLHTALAGKVNTGLDNLSTDGENKVKDLAAGAVKVAAGKNVTVTPTTVDHVTTYTVDAIDTTVAAGDGLSVTGGDTVDTTTNKRNYTVALSQATKDTLAKVETLTNTVGANGADGRDGKVGTGKDPQAADATAGDKGLTGKDGLNGKDLTSKVNALRNGEAGTVVYTDENGNRLAKANDGQYYPATNVDKDGNVLNNAQPVTAPQARLVNPNGTTTGGTTKLSNIADGDIKAGSKDAINGGQLHATNERVNAVEEALKGKLDKVDLEGKADKTQVKALEDRVTKGRVFTADTKDGDKALAAEVGLGDTLAIQGGAEMTRLTDNNIGVELALAKDGKPDTMTVKLAKDLKMADGKATYDWYVPEFEKDATGLLKLDEHRNPIPKKDQKGNIIYQKDGNGKPIVNSSTVVDGTGTTYIINNLKNDGTVQVDNENKPVAGIVTKVTATGTRYEERLTTDDGHVIFVQDDDTKALNPVLKTVSVVDSNGIRIGSHDKPVVSLTKDGLNNGGNRITNVSPGIEATDAATVGQLQSVTNTMTAQVNEAGAHAAALAAMNPLSYDPLKKSQVMAGVGAYKGNKALALGVAHYANEDTMFNVGVSVGGGNNMMNAGVTYRFGGEDSMIPERYKGGPISSVYILQDEVTALKAENAQVKADNAQVKADNARMKENYEKVMQDNEEMKAQIKMLMAHMGIKS